MSIEDLAAGSGAVVSQGLKKMAVYKDEEGRVHTYSGEMQLAAGAGAGAADAAGTGAYSSLYLVSLTHFSLSQPPARTWAAASTGTQTTVPLTARATARSSMNLDGSSTAQPRLICFPRAGTRRRGRQMSSGQMHWTSLLRSTVHTTGTCRPQAWP